MSADDAAEIGFIGTYTYSAQDPRHGTGDFDGKFGSFDWVDQRPLSRGQGPSTTCSPAAWMREKSCS